MQRGVALPEISRSQTTDAFCRYPAVFLEIGLSFPGSPLLLKKKERKKKCDRVQTVTPLSLAEPVQFSLVSSTAFQSRALSNTFFFLCVTLHTGTIVFVFTFAIEFHQMFKLPLVETTRNAISVVRTPLATQHTNAICSRSVTSSLYI